VVAYPEGEQLELIDGFKRAAVARQLRWDSLRVQIAAVDSGQATVLLAELAERAALSALEQGWLVQALHRKEGLSQGEIAAQLGRHKSWVCRRLLLVEQLDFAVQQDIRLGLLAPRAAAALVALPRGNQQQAAQIAAKRGLTVKQTERFVAELSSCTDAEQTHAVLSAWSEGERAARGMDRSARRPSSGADRLMADIAAMRAVCARLHGRIIAVPLSGLRSEAAQLVSQQLRELEQVMGSVRQSIASAVQTVKEGDA
jgi:ParB-like chromosome segregation protein Spo0J